SAQTSIQPAPSPGELADVQNPSTSASESPASSRAPRTHSAWIWNGWTPGAFLRGDSYAPTTAMSPLQLTYRASLLELVACRREPESSRWGARAHKSGP